MLELRLVSKRFDDGLLALDRIDLEVGAGEIVVVIGSSGCGKSTMLRLIAGLEAPTGGSVHVAGHPIAGPGADVGVVFQEPRLMPWLTVEENVRFGLNDLPASQARTLATESLTRVGLAQFADSLPRQLSGGMAQRAAIARALVVKPPVLLLDEPFSALDAFTRVDLQEHLLDVWTWYRPTLFIVTHDIEEALTLADWIVVMEGQPGRIADVITVDLARPRQRGDQVFNAKREQVLTALGATYPVQMPV
ncbi:MAG TPA: ABC transporter ATP-binding protein [Acidimicrobiia bacterium]|nr:ABC transporter ATP-binding protein [Acidimicrobiia bacterium]